MISKILYLIFLVLMNKFNNKKKKLVNFNSNVEFFIIILKIYLGKSKMIKFL